MDTNTNAKMIPEFTASSSEVRKRMMYGIIDSISLPEPQEPLREEYPRGNFICIVGGDKLRIFSVQEKLEERVMHIKWHGGGGLGVPFTEDVSSQVVGEEVRYDEYQTRMLNYDLTLQQFFVGDRIIVEQFHIQRY